MPEAAPEILKIDSGITNPGEYPSDVTLKVTWKVRQRQGMLMLRLLWHKSSIANVGLGVAIYCFVYTGTFLLRIFCYAENFPV